MKSNSILILIVFTTILFSGCSKDDFCNCLQPEGAQASEYRIMAPFDKMTMNNNVDIVLVPDSMPGVTVTCGKNLLDGIRTTVTDGILSIENINRCNWLRDFNNKFTVEVHYTTLNHITNNGSGMLTCADTLRGESLTVDNWNGTGTLNFILNTYTAHLNIHTGPADIAASGLCGVLYVYSAGNGFIKTADCNSGFVYVTTKSTGDCEVFADKELGVTILYDGDVYYRGNPASIIEHDYGNGNLIAF